ncbi:O-antigen ligase family protein [Streptomyces caeni]|uniref:O-antigen ligase family protein n=1 Tax=Streptomyces caeni TaxID=2307231 RepID=A0ABW4IV90_9ACTN
MHHLAVAVDTAPSLFAALTLAIALLWIFARHYSVGVGLLLASQVWIVVAHGRLPALDVGLHAYPADFLSACACLVALSRLLLHRVPARAGVLLILGMMALTVWSIVRGIGVGGFQTAANDSRVYFFQVFAFTLYVATAPLSAAMGRVIGRAWLAAAAVYVVLSLAGWADAGLQAVGSPTAAVGAVTDARPVPANAALMLVQGAVLLLCPPASDPRVPGRAGGGRSGTRRHRLIRSTLAVLLFVCVILLQHRTVWVVAAVVVVVYWALRPSPTGQRVATAVAGVLVGCLTAVCYGLGVFGSVGGKVAASLADAQDSHSTFVWRILGWQELLSAPRPWVDWVVGSPFGSGYVRIVEGGLITVSPHDYYVHVALRLGLVGLLLLVAVYTQVWWRLPRDGPGGLLLRLLIVSQLVFCAAYSASPEQGLLLGLCLWQIRFRTADRGTGKRSADVPGPLPRPAVVEPRTAWVPAGSGASHRRVARAAPTCT